MVNKKVAIFGKGTFAQANYGWGVLMHDPRKRLFSFVAWKKIGKVVSPTEGIYQRQPSAKGQIVRKLKFYRPTDPKSPAQLAMREKYFNAVGAWRALTENEKSQYNKRASGKRFTGWNLFYKEYLLSH